MLVDIVFFAIVMMALTAAFMAVWLKNVFYNALSLIVCLFGVACLFIYLNSEFLAIIEVIIYIGAISIAIIFAIMLSQPMFQKKESRNLGKILRSLLIAGFLFTGIVRTLRATQWPIVSVEGDYSMKAMGRAFLTTSLLPFEAVSLILLVAIVGALVISSGRNVE